MHWKVWFFNKIREPITPLGNKINKAVKLSNAKDLDEIASCLVDKPDHNALDWRLIRYSHLYLADNKPSHRALLSFTRNFKRMLSYKLVFGYPKGWDDALGFSTSSQTGKARDTNKTSTILDEDAFNKIADYAASQWTKHHNPAACKLAFKMAYYMGLSQADLGRLRLQDIHESDNGLLLWADGRLIDVPRHLLDDVRARIEDRKNVKARKYNTVCLFTHDQVKYIAKYPDVSKTLAALKRIRA